MIYYLCFLIGSFFGFGIAAILVANKKEYKKN